MIYSLCFDFAAETQCASNLRLQNMSIRIQAKQWQSIVFPHTNLFNNVAFIQWKV